MHAGWTEYFFDGIELEVWDNKIEGARINYDGNLALSWQVLWKGPFILDQQLDGAKEPGEHLPSFLAEHSHRWKGEKSYLYLDSGCSAANYVNATDAAGFSAWSISYNKLTDKLEQLARALPESAWRCWSGADGLIEQYAWPAASARGLCPGACVCGGAAQAVRGVVLQVWVCDVRTCGASQSGGGCLNGTRSRGAKEQCFSQLLSDLDLQYPPCLELIANQMFYAIATLTYNILVAVRVMELPDDAQGWRIQSMVRHLLTVPVVISRHARYRRAKVCASRMA